MAVRRASSMREPRGGSSPMVARANRPRSDVCAPAAPRSPTTRCSPGSSSAGTCGTTSPAAGTRPGTGGTAAPRPSSRPASKRPGSARHGSSPPPTPKPSTSPASSAHPDGAASPQATPRSGGSSSPRSGGGSASPATSRPATATRSRTGSNTTAGSRPSRPRTTYPQTRDHGAPRPAAVSQQTLQRQERSALFFTVNRRGGNVILHHRHIQPVLIRDWSPQMDGITAAIWASQTTIPHGPPELRQAARRTTASAGNKEAAAQRHAEDGPLPALVSEIAT